MRRSIDQAPVGKTADGIDVSRRTECFYEDANMLYIDPQECIDCDACVPECPVEAIFREDDVPKQWQHFIGLNAAKAKTCPSAYKR